MSIKAVKQNLLLPNNINSLLNVQTIITIPALIGSICMYVLQNGVIFEKYMKISRQLHQK